MNIWQRKLLAFLHDPPEKAYDFSKRHVERAAAHANAFGLDPSMGPLNNPDWWTSAADRFIFPDGKKIAAKLGEGLAFRHPFADADIRVDQMPDQNAAESAISDAIPTFTDTAMTDQDRFWLAWRLWRDYAGSHENTPNAGWLAYLPADTRILDHTIWHRCAAASALEATRAGDGKNDPLRPAFLLFQIGPVQEFIAQARSTRDLWSGSYLLSWLTMAAMQPVIDRFGPDCIVFPSLRGQPLHDWRNRKRLDAARHRSGQASSISALTAYGMEERDRPFQDAVLTPTIPNRFLAVVPADFDPKDCCEALNREWNNIAATCRDWLKQAGHDIPARYEEYWRFQIARQWQTTWQSWPWGRVPDTLALADQRLPGMLGERLQRAHAIVKAIPGKERDGRCYLDQGDPNPGWAWAALYALTSHAHDARRQTRDFAAWMNPAHTARMAKDAFSGREEVVVDDEWMKAAKNDTKIRHLFRKDDLLGAANLIKRVWDVAYLQDKAIGLSRSRKSFDSVPAIAAAPWVRRVRSRVQASPDCADAFVDLSKLLWTASDFLDDVTIASKSDLLDAADAQVFHKSYWEKLDDDIRKKDAVVAAAKALADFKKRFNLGEPSRYYAVLALDGDEMGKWLSGENAPAVCKTMAPEAQRYFVENVGGGKEWLGDPRPISPSYHLQFSEALSNFGLYCARRIVEWHDGQLVYAGGDDVLAMLPADETIACANDLRLAFQGSLEPAKRKTDDGGHGNGSEDGIRNTENGKTPLSSVFHVPFEGFVQLADDRHASEPSWPLLMPGPNATVSVGIAIGHIREPLQDMVQAAQDAEKRAKRGPEKGGFGRNALAVTLFKRSGETVQWGARFDSPAFPLLDFLREHYRPDPARPDERKPIPGKFPYRVAELLRRYDGAEPTTVTGEIREIVKAEMKWAVGRLEKCPGAIKDGLRERMDEYLHALADFKRKTKDGKEEPCPRPLAEFWNLFAVEAFVARQED